MTTTEKMNQARSAEKPIDIKLLESHPLVENTKYNKCPVCWWVKQKNEYWTFDKLMSMQNVHYKKTLETYRLSDGSFKKVIEERYVCQECGRENTVEDFEKLWCKKYIAGNELKEGEN